MDDAEAVSLLFSAVEAGLNSKTSTLATGGNGDGEIFREIALTDL